MSISQISDESKSEDAKVRDVSVDWNAPTGAYEFELDPDTHELDEAYKEPNQARSFPQEVILREFISGDFCQIIEPLSTFILQLIVGLKLIFISSFIMKLPYG